MRFGRPLANDELLKKDGHDMRCGYSGAWKGAIRIASETFMDQPDGSARPFFGKRFKDHLLEHFLL